MNSDDRIVPVSPDCWVRFQPATGSEIQRAPTTVEEAAKASKYIETENCIEGFNQPTYRGLRINGQRVATWSSQLGWSGGWPARCGVDPLTKTRLAKFGSKIGQVWKQI